MQVRTSNRRIKRALISVTDKTNVVAFARALVDEFGVQLISTGGSARTLRDAGIPVRDVSDVTGFPEIMDGRVKTLHPRIHGALLAVDTNDAHMKQAEEHNIELIDMVVVNLYAFETYANSGASADDCINHIDIGGPSMIRSAAKNFARVAVVTQPSSYDALLEEMRVHSGALTAQTREKLARDAFELTSSYDTHIAQWFADQCACHETQPDSETCEGGACSIASHAADDYSLYPQRFEVHANKISDLRYGENPHQNAAVFCLDQASKHALARAVQHNGKPLSYNNWLDMDACYSCVREFKRPCVVIVKHQNPCGCAEADNIVDAYDAAYSCDPKSAYGGIIAANRRVEAEMVQHMFNNHHFVEVIVAPSYSAEALELLKTKKNLRVMETGQCEKISGQEIRSIDGGLLVQDLDAVREHPGTFTIVTKKTPTVEQLDDLIFAWRVVKSVKSNAILVAYGKRALGLGPGQPNRVDSAQLACSRAHEACARLSLPDDNLVAASDAFLPFADNVELFAEQGIKAIIQPGGSIRDEECIQACNQHGIAMVLTGTRHFRH